MSGNVGSLWAILLTNALVLVSALVGYLDGHTLLFVYWIEALLLGLFFAFKLQRWHMHRGRGRKDALLDAVTIAFGYCFVTSMFLYPVVGVIVTGSLGAASGGTTAVLEWVVRSAHESWFIMLALTFQYAYAYKAIYLAHREYETVSFESLAIPLMAHIVFLFIAAGAVGLMLALIAPVYGAFLVVVKAALDLWGYLGRNTQSKATGLRS